MNGPHDLGGRDGFGPVIPETDEPVFHADWEGRALGVTLCSGALGHWSLDESRHARESLAPATYLTASYYEIWLRALETLLLRHGEVTETELQSGEPDTAPRHAHRQLKAGAVLDVLRKGGPVDRPKVTEAAFAIGSRVRMRPDRIPGHTRIPGYAKGKAGTVTGIRGVHVFPDTNAHGQGENPQWLYAVRFDGTELWGAGAEPGTAVTLDVFEPYITAL